MKKKKITIHLTCFFPFFFFFSPGKLAAMTLDCVGIWKSDVGASGTGQRSGEGPAFLLFIYLFI